MPEFFPAKAVVRLPTLTSLSYHYPALHEWAGTTWDWEDGTPLTIGGPMVNHVYKNPGTYLITMKFTDTERAQGTDTREIRVLSR